MRKVFDNPAGTPKPLGRYSQVVRLDLGGGGSLVVLSGQVACAEDGAVLAPGDMRAQTEFIFETIGKLLAAHGASFTDLINIRTYLTDIGRLAEYAEVRRRYITGEPPTSTTMEVARLVKPDLLVEVEVMAAIDSQS